MDYNVLTLFYTQHNANGTQYTVKATGGGVQIGLDCGNKREKKWDKEREREKERPGHLLKIGG